MKLEEMLKQQEKRGLKQKKIKAKMQSYDEYVQDDSSPRPYNTPNVLDLLKINSPPSFLISKETQRDTESTITPSLQRDTESTIAPSLQRDTESTVASSLQRDTESTITPSLQRDTESTVASSLQRDTESTVASSWKRDTKSTITPSWKRDTEIMVTSPLQRDTEITRNSSLNLQVGRPSKGLTYKYSNLTGNAKKLVDEIINRCIIFGGVVTPYISKLDFSETTGVKLGAIKTTICRLKEKHVLTDYEATKGRNSCWKFTLSSEILDEYISTRRGK